MFLASRTKHVAHASRVASSTSTQPRLNTSAANPYASTSPSSSSGAMYSGVPQSVLHCEFSSASRAMPKSQSLPRQSWESSTFSAFTSLCITPRSWRYARPRHASPARRSRSGQPSSALPSSNLSRSPPAHSSVSSVVPSTTPTKRTTCSWSQPRSMRISCARYLATSASSRSSSSFRTGSFAATTRPPCVARTTRANLPRPISGPRTTSAAGGGAGSSSGIGGDAGSVVAATPATPPVASPAPGPGS